MRETNSNQTSYKQLLENDHLSGNETSSGELEEMNLLKRGNNKSQKDGRKNNEIVIVNGKVMTLNGDRPWKCTFERCDKSFIFRCRLEKHEKTHSEEVISLGIVIILCFFFQKKNFKLI